MLQEQMQAIGWSDQAAGRWPRRSAPLYAVLRRRQTDAQSTPAALPPQRRLPLTATLYRHLACGLAALPSTRIKIDFLLTIHCHLITS